MELKKALIDGVREVLYQFGMNPLYIGESEEEFLASASPVNVLVGLNTGIRGNVVLGLDKVTAIRIVSAMMNGAKIKTLDNIAKSALAEFTNMVMGSAISKIADVSHIDYSPPTVVIGKKLYLVISRLKSHKLTFEMDENFYDLSICIE